MENAHRSDMLPLAWALVAGVSISGCASSPPLRTELSTSGVQTAEEVGMAKAPRAAVHWQLAELELESARELRAQGSHEKGASMLLRAQADGELAVSLSRNTAEASEAEVAAAHVHELQQDHIRNRTPMSLQ